MFKSLQISSSLRVWSFLKIWALTVTGEKWIRRQVFSLQKTGKNWSRPQWRLQFKNKFKFEKEGASRKCKKRPLLSRDQEVRLFNKLLYWLDRVVFLFASISYWTRPCWTVIMKKILPFSPLFMITKPEKLFWSLSCGFVANNRQNTEGYDWIYPVLSKAERHILCVDFPFASSFRQWLTFKMALLKAKLPKESPLSRILSCQEPV